MTTFRLKFLNLSLNGLQKSVSLDIGGGLSEKEQMQLTKLLIIQFLTRYFNQFDRRMKEKTNYKYSRFTWKGKTINVIVEPKKITV